MERYEVRFTDIEEGNYVANMSIFEINVIIIIIIIISKDYLLTAADTLPRLLVAGGE